MKPFRAEPNSVLAYQVAEILSSVIPGRAKREPQMCNCTSGNLEIPGSALRAAPE
jgi:hypothetical protein